MTDLEDRVRDALLARAGEFTTSPDAWERMKTKAGRRTFRRPARQRWLTQLTPLAAAAAVIVIGAGTATVAGTGGFSSSPAPLVTQSSGPGLGGWVGGAPCAFPGESTKVAGVPISAKVTLDGVTTWWTRIESDFSVLGRERKSDLAMCQSYGDDTGAAGYAPYGVDAGMPVYPFGKGQLVQASTPITGDDRGSEVTGIAVTAVVSVEADLANGRVVRGSVAYGHGFPYVAWWVNYPQGISATLVFRDAAGHAVKQIAAPYPEAIALRHPAPVPPLGGSSPCQQARVPQVMDGIKVWTYVGVSASMLCETTGLATADVDYRGTYTMPAGQSARTSFVLYPTSSVSGIADKSVTSVTAVLPGGSKYPGTLVRGKRFKYPVWIVSYPLKDPATLVFRNAAGKEVAVLHEPANP
ncbi:MAG TPA: hypothetical protein VH594_07805 [Trebonia sp.]|jgi:hypothetical protein